jgi:hypothetical protein
VTNLFDKYCPVNRLGIRGAGVSALREQAGRPRESGITAKKDF